MNDSRKAPALADVPIPDLLRHLSTDTATLVRQEFALARAEALAQVASVRQAAIGIGGAALLGLGAFGAMTVALIELLHLAMPLWLASLIVAVAYGAIAAVAATKGRAVFARASTAATQHSVESVRDDVAAVRAGIARGR